MPSVCSTAVTVVAVAVHGPGSFDAIKMRLIAVNFANAMLYHLTQRSRAPFHRTRRKTVRLSTIAANQESNSDMREQKPKCFGLGWA